MLLLSVLPLTTTLAITGVVAQGIPPRFGGVLATGPSGIVFLGGRIKLPRYDGALKTLWHVLWGLSHFLPAPSSNTASRAQTSLSSEHFLHLAFKDSPLQQQQLLELQAGVVVVSYASQSVSAVNTPDPDNRLSSDAQACAQVGTDLYCHGGYVVTDIVNNNGSLLPSNFAVLDLTTNTWQPNPQILPQIPSLMHHTLVMQGTGGLIFGGDTGMTGTVSNIMYTFDLASRRVTQQSQVPSPRSRHCGTSLSTDSLFVFGGNSAADQSQGTLLGDAFIYRMATQTWTVVGGTSQPPSARFGSSCAAIGQKVYVFGGYDGTLKDLNDLWVFDNTSNTWSEIGTTGAVPSIRTYSSMTSLGSEFLVVSGMTVWLSFGTIRGCARYFPGGQANLTATDPTFYFLNVTSSTWFPGNIIGPLPYRADAPVTSTETTTVPTSSSSIPTSSTHGTSSSSPEPVSPSPGSSSSTGSASAVLPAVGGAIGSLVVILGVTYFMYRRHAQRQKPSPTNDHIPIAPLSASSTDDNGGAPPAYDDEVYATLRTRADATPAVRYRKYRGLCLFSPTRAGEIACKLGDEIIIREVFPDRWARATNITEARKDSFPYPAWTLARISRALLPESAGFWLGGGPASRLLPPSCDVRWESGSMGRLRWTGCGLGAAL
ncbi:hypothetical protein BDK51DRAFT_51740 [Blyttiomyces helicus]|uniref:SH3 domain-containing protein n=1 Tax=Blyttiomyces helicus TaxID=388810 RepID=A0A4P9W3R7_9FUNG|nr:hypothetical protein BDK51DRAFT_51740 [Blyttiomyces helicus]|eukprot:RKO86482.1 hypothetical protein BDK51DRAFT_51740 [Blyttiomyces helicus]